MDTTNVLFNRNNVKYISTMEKPDQYEIKNTFGLFHASYDDAVRYGGEITREALRHVNLRHDRKNIIVDTKVHMLMPGWSPAILGMHTDGAPRSSDKNPRSGGEPNIFAQEGDDHYNRYHIMVSGEGCLTQYINTPLWVPIPSKPSYDVYSVMFEFVQTKVKESPEIVSEFKSCGIYEFDWWNIHTGVIAKKKEWRYLIRITESDYYEPLKDLREVIRNQSQVYSPANFGW